MVHGADFPITVLYHPNAPATVTSEEIEDETQRRYRWINSDSEDLLDLANAFEEGVKWSLSLDSAVTDIPTKATVTRETDIHAEWGVTSRLAINLRMRTFPNRAVTDVDSERDARRGAAQDDIYVAVCREVTDWRMADQ